MWILPARYSRRVGKRNKKDMLKRVLAISASLLVFTGSYAYAAEAAIYKNIRWGFQISVPGDWSVTEADQITRRIESEAHAPEEVVSSVKNSGLIVSISQFPFDLKNDFNPNISISAKNIEITPKPKDEKDALAFAGNVLSGLLSSGEGERSPAQEINIGKLPGVISAYQYAIGDSRKINADIAVLIDKERDNYFIITGTYQEDNPGHLRQFRESLNSFRKL